MSRRISSRKFGYSIPDEELQDVRRICVLCWGLIGDVFFRVPIIEALAQRFPDASITVVVDPAGKAVVENHPDCDEVVVISRKKDKLVKYLIEFISKAIKLRRSHFDLFVNLYSGGSSPLLTRLSKARIRLGFDHTPALRKANNLLVKKVDFCQHWARALGKKLVPLGIAEDRVRRGTSFIIPEQSRQEAEKLLHGKTNLVAFNLGAGVAEKRWPIEKYVALARKIHADYDFSPVVFTNPDMEELAREFASQYGETECYLMPVLPLAVVAAVMQKCVALVTGDTSLMHMAIGIKKPHLVLFTYTRPELVKPDDCIQVSCFIENPEELNECGLPTGSLEIPVGYAFEKFHELYETITREK